jgi:riboflavin kinase/FMN adenylyltransferase
VYITRTCFPGDSRSHRSVTNIGMRPTFNGTALTVETHLLDFHGEIPAERIEVRFWKRLREEKKFNDAAELRQQIARDIAGANRFFDRLRRLRSAQLV